MTVLHDRLAFPVPVEEDTPPEASEPEAIEASVIFSDETYVPETVSPASTQSPDLWRYASDQIEVVIRRIHRDDFVYFAVGIQLADASQFACAFSGERYGAQEEALSDMARRNDPLLAINGDYYGFHNNGIIIRGGELFRRNKSSRALLAVEANGDLTVQTDRRDAAWTLAQALMDRGVLHAFEFGPVLVENGERVPLESAILRVGKGYKEPRTAIGQLGPLHYLVLIVDGRTAGYSAGCDLPTLQQLFIDHGAYTAFNLDGGGSTALWFDGEILNRPSAGGERKVSDIIMFMREPSMTEEENE